MALAKIVESDLVGHTVVGQADTPGLSVEDMQLAIEAISRGVIIPKYNAMVDALKSTAEGDSGAQNIGVAAIPGIIGSNVQAILAGLKAYADSLALSAGAVTSVHGRAGAVVAQDGDYTLPQVGGSRPNILINWYFKSPINQTGLASWTVSGYTIDCWKAEKSAEATYNIQLTASGMVLAEKNAIAQRQLEFAFLNGRVVTASAMINNLLYSISFTWDATKEYIGLTPFSNGYRFAYNGLGNVLQLHNVSGPGGLTVNAVKLELGTGQTLAYQDAGGNWLLNDPPSNPQQELAKCQRYFIRLGKSNTAHVAFAQASTTAMANAVITTPVTMRAVPAITFYNTVLRNGVTDTAITTMNPFIANANSVYCGISVASGLTAGTMYALRTANGYIDLDANL